MGFWTRLFVAFAVLVAAPYYWLMIDSRTGAIAAHPIDIGRLRQVAQEMPGPRPVSIEYVPVAIRRAAGGALVAGGGLKPDLIGVVAFRLVSPAGDIVIDSGMTRRSAQAAKFNQWSPQAQARVDQWMQRARTIVFTHEHADHVDGFLNSPRFAALAPKVIAPVEQHTGMLALKPGARLAQPLVYGDFAAVAPGVVLLRTPGHTPGSQMIYVQLQNGREFLFTGDTASMQRNVTWQRPRSHLMSDWIMPENRPATIAWIKGLGQLAARNPALTLVYSHDLAWLSSSRGPGFHTDLPFPLTIADRLDDDDATPANKPVAP